MKKQGITQEGLKIIACSAMLADHIGAVLVPEVGLRIVGRLAFPIYCFLLAEGAARTRNPKKYGLRLALGAVFSEIPFDLLFFGGLTWHHQNVMVTLLLGFSMLMVIRQKGSAMRKLLAAAVFSGAAELLGADYGGLGVLMIALFAVTRERKDRTALRTVGLTVICWLLGGYGIRLGVLQVPVQMFAVCTMIPIACYSGAKATMSKAVQWVFYLFYPLHLMILLILTS